MKLIHAIMKHTVPFKKVDGEILEESKLKFVIKQTGIGAVVTIQKQDIEKLTIYMPPPLAVHVFGVV